MEVTKLKKVNRITQKPGMKIFIDKNSEEGAKAKTELRIFFYKNLTCSLSGKQMEDLRRRKRKEFVIFYGECLQDQSKFSFDRFKEHQAKIGDTFLYQKKVAEL